VAVYTLTHGIYVDEVAAVQTLTPNEVQVGDSVTIASAGTKFTGTFTVISLEPYYYTGKDDSGYLTFDYDEARPNQVLYAHPGHDNDDTYYAISGTLTDTVSVSWITSSDVTTWLGIAAATANDTAFLAFCVNASNAFCYRKRVEAGYKDSQSTAPGGDVKLGAIMYAATLYRERGSVDSFASFDSMGSFPIPSTLGRIMQLLGCGRAQVA
jgi:hypothetical protein